MNKLYFRILQFLLLTFITASSYSTYAKNSSIIDSRNALYEVEWSFIKTLIDEDLEMTFERRDSEINSTNEKNLAPACKDITIYLDATGNISILPTNIDPSNTGTNFSLDRYNFNCTDIGSPITVTVHDASDPTGDCTSQVTVLDNISPIITLNGDNPQQIEACDAYTELGANATDNCSGNLTGSILIDASAVDTNVVGTYTVTYNVTDANSNAATEVTRTVNVVDNTLPTITLNGDATMTIEACDTYTEPGATADDGCLSIGAVIIGGDTVDPTTVGTYTVTYNVTDANSNAATEVIRTIEVVDTTIPTITLNGDATMTIEACGTYTESGATADDGCLSIGAVIIGGDTVDPTTVGTYTVTYNVTDANSNAATEVIRTIEVVDTTIPTITLNGNATMTIETCGTYTEPGATADDGCLTIGAVIIGGDTVDPTTVGTYTLTYNVTDANSNAATEVIRTIEVVDTTIPTITLNGDATMNIEACDTYIEPGATADDGCLSIGAVIIGGDTVDPTTVGTYTVTYNVTDANSNAATEVIRTIEVVDTTIPIITLNGNATMTIETCGTYTEPGAIADDGCLTIGAVIIGGDTVDPTTVGTYTVTYNVTDANSNAATEVIRTIEVVDTTIPTITLNGDATMNIEACDTYIEPGATANDPCFGDISGSIVVDASAVNIGVVGSYNVTYNVTDVDGNPAAQVTRTVNVVDNSAPTITLTGANPQIIEACGTYTELNATANDPCFGDISGSIVVDASAVNTAVVGTYTVTYNVTDVDGNPADQVTRTVNVVDTTIPTISLNGDATVTVEACATYNDLGATANDPCFGDISGSIVTNTSTVNTAVVGTYSVTYNVTDANSNAAIQVTRTVNVVDTTVPTITLTGANPQTIEACAPYIELGATANDPCFGNISGSITIDASAVNTNVVGTYVVTYNVADAHGNNATQISRNVNVVDTTPPTFVSPPLGITVNNDSGVCGAIVTFTIPTATDNCLSATVSQTDGPASGSTFPIGDTTIEFTATDTNSNTSVHTFTITVIDNEPPVLTCSVALVIVDADDDCEVKSLTLPVPPYSDNCGILNPPTNDLAGQLPLPVGNHTVTWTVTDTAGLITTCTQAIQVIDNTPPVIACPTPDSSYDTDLNQCHATLSFAASATDNCTGSALISYEIGGNPISFPYDFPTGSTTVVVIAEDGYGVTSTCNFEVVVVDNQAPIAACQPPFSISLDASGDATITAADINNGSSDACGGTLNLSIDKTSFNCGDIGSNEVTLTVTDDSGNSATCTTIVTVEDYIQNGIATITSSVASPICSGTSVTFNSTATNLGLGTVSSYQWYQGGVLVPGATSTNYTTTTLANGDDIYVEMEVGPCNTLLTSNSITMSVSPLLPVSFTLNSSANPACSGDSLNFFVNGLTNGGASPSYQWFLNSAPVGTNANSYGPLTTIVNGDVISVTVTSSATCGNPMTVSQSLTMTVNPLPTISALGNGNNVSTLTICEGLPLTLTGSGGSTYIWDNGVVNNVSFVPTVGTHTYTVIGTNSNGCKNSDTITVTVNPNTSITLLSASADQSVCRTGNGASGIVENIDFSVFNATTVTVTGLPTGVNGVYNAGLNRVRISGNPSNSVSGIFPYTITATNSCNTVTSTGIITVYYETPSTPGAVNGPESFLCPVTTAIYYVAPDPNVETYNWTVPGSMTIINGQGTNQIEVSLSGTFAFLQRISVTASNPCGTSGRRDKWVLLNFSGPSINAGNDIYVCEGTNIVTMAGDADGISNTEWEWSDNAAGGEFSSVGTYTPPRYCIDRYWWGGCREYAYPPPRDLYSETSTYTLPTGAVAGDIITISLIADSGGFTWCDDIVDNMRVHVIANPTAEFITVDAVCFGDSLTITGTPNSTVSYSYNGTPAGSFPIGNSGTVTFPSQPAGVYELTSVQYTNPPNSNGVGCINTITGETVTINQPPTVAAPADAIICAGETVNLSTASIGGTNATGSWSTSGTGGFSGSSYTPSVGDINFGSVTLTYTNTPSDGVCPGVSDSMLITINPLPTANAGVNQTICADRSITLNGNIGGNAISSTWSAPSGSFNDPSLLNATYTPSIVSGTVTLTLTADNPEGCGPVTSTVVITVNPASIADAGVGVTVCDSNPIALSGSFSGSATFATWSSSTGGTFLPNANTMNATYTPSTTDIAAGNVILTLTSSNPAGICDVGVDTVEYFFNKTATVDAGIGQAICAAALPTLTTINLNATLGGTASSGTWTSSGNGSFNNNNPNAIYTIGSTDITNGSVTLTYTTDDPDGVSGPCSIVSDDVIFSIVPFVNATASTSTVISSCSDTTIQLSANGSGTWSATPTTPSSVFSFSSTTNPNATFTGESGAEYTLTWTLVNPAPCATDTASFVVDFMNCEDNLTFNGINNSVNFNNAYNLSGNFSIEAWIKPNAITGFQTILSKRDANNLATSGYDLRLSNSNIQFYVNNVPLSRGGITTSRWHHIAVTFDGATYTLYVDGLSVNSRPSTDAPTANTANTLLGAMSRPGNTPTNYYNGWMDEVRIWNTSLSVDQIRLMMNQEIEDDAGSVIGSETGALVPTGLSWSNLTAYYQMNRIADVAGGNLMANAGVNGILRNMTAQQSETAPVPYVSRTDGDWTNRAIWSADTFQQTPNSNGVNGLPVEWNIVRTQNNISSTNKNIKVLGLLVDNNTLSIENTNPNNGQKLEVTKYLKIDGTLDLNGESQLIQPIGSIVDYSGTGELERDQQGTGNMFNYNYWGSPVSTAGSAGARTFDLRSILYDGDLIDELVGWTSTSSVTITSPITVSTRWLYTYSGHADDYDVWQRITPDTPLETGLGFLMKGSGAPAAVDKNLTFKGQPNNGTIKVAIGGPNQAVVVGNPYPSAIDAFQFFTDNVGVIKLGGALQFWEQSPGSSTHIYKQYQGRYAYLNKTGSVGAAVPVDFTDAGGATKIPKRYIPVGQGFYVEGDADGGEIEFNNGQRYFVQESIANSVFLKNYEENSNTTSDSGEPDFEDHIQRVRLAFKTPEGAIRHLLLGFVPDNSATDGIDYGFDGLNGDEFPSDLSFLIDGQKFVIQGVGAFDINKKYPLDMTLGIPGNVELALTELENFDEPIDVYVHDAVLDTYTKINEVSYQMAMKPGNYPDRFSIVFRPDETLSIIDQDFKDISVKYLQKTDEIYVKTPASIEVRQIYLVNMAGQSVRSWNMTNMNFSQEFKIPVKDVSEGNYILQVETGTNSYNKKVIIKF